MATISRQRLKEIVKEVLKEESEYQTFFKKALEKAGKSITAMSDDEKKEFFNKIDAAWSGRGEKNEELVGNQHKLDVDGDGEIEASDLAALRAGEEKEESVNEAASRTAMEIAGLTGLNKDAIQKFVDTHNMDIEKVYQYVKKSKLTDRLNFVTAIVGTPGNSVQKKMIKMFGESVNEAVSSKDMDKIKAAVQAASSFMSVGTELKKTGMKYTFATSPMPIYIVQPTPNNRVAIVNKKYASGPDFVHGDIAVGVMEGKSINEIEYKDAVEKFNADLMKNSQVERIAKFHKRSIKDVVKALQPYLKVLKYSDKSVKVISIDFRDTNSDVKVHVSQTYKQNESINESFKHFISVDTPTQVVSKKVAAEVEALVKKGVRSKDIGLKMGFVGNQKAATDAFQKLKNQIYFKLDKRESVMEGLSPEVAKHMVNIHKGFKMVETDGVMVYDSPSNAKKASDFLNSKKIAASSNGKYVYLESINEGRAFINAAKKAKAEGKTEFEFNGKKYPVTIKD